MVDAGGLPDAGCALPARLPESTIRVQPKLRRPLPSEPGSGAKPRRRRANGRGSAGVLAIARAAVADVVAPRHEDDLFAEVGGVVADALEELRDRL